IGLEPAHEGPEDVSRKLHDHIIRSPGRGADIAHTPRVGAFVIVREALVVTGGRQHFRAATANEYRETDFPADEAFLGEHDAGGITEAALAHQELGGGAGFLAVRTDD